MRKIKWGVLGTAGIAKGCTIPGMLLAENCELYAIAGRSLEKAESFKAEFGFEKAYGSYEEMLADPMVEAVYIPLPNEMHHEWAIKAMRAKKHVLCEKPLAPTTAEVEEMIQVSEEEKVFLMEAFAYLHSPYMEEMRAIVANGEIGNVVYAESEFLTSDYDISNIRMRRETFGGSTYDLGCYTISQIQWILGKEPVKVSAVADFSGENVDMLTTGILKFEDGVKARFTCGMVLATEQDKRVDHLEIHGTKGYIKSDIAFNQAGELCYEVCIDGVVTKRTAPAKQNYSLEVEQLGKCITEGEKTWVNSAFTMGVSRTLTKVLESISYS